MQTSLQQGTQNFDKLPANVSKEKIPRLPGKTMKPVPATAEQMKIFDDPLPETVIEVMDADIIGPLSDQEFRANMATEHITTTPGGNVSEPKNQQNDGPPLASVLVMHKLNLVTLCLIALAWCSEAVRRFLRLKDGFAIRLVSNKPTYAEYYEIPPGTPLHVSNLQKAGFRFLFDPEDQETWLTTEYRKSEMKSVLEFVAKGSGLFQTDPGFYPVVQAIIENATHHTGLMKHSESQNIFEKMGMKAYVHTPTTTRDLKVFVDYVTIVYGERKGWDLAIDVMIATLYAAKELPAHAQKKTASMTSIMLPETLLSLDKNTFYATHAVFKKREELFEAGYTRLKSGQVNPWNYDADIKEAGPDTESVPRFMTVKGRAHEGEAIFRSWTDDRLDPTATIMPQVVRKDLTDEVRDTQRSRAPRLTARFFEGGYVHVQSGPDADTAVDLTVFAVALRKGEVMARNDLTVDDKKRVLADEKLLSSINAPEYAPGKRSYVILEASRLGLGNTYDSGNKAIPLSNEKIANILTGVIDASRVERKKK